MGNRMDHKMGELILCETKMCLDIACYDLPYYIIQGTVLGAYRDKGFCPDERDIDFGMMFEDFYKIMPRLVYELSRRDYTVRTVAAPFTLPRLLKAEKRGVHVDIVSFVKWKESRFCHNTDPRTKPYSVVYHQDLFDYYEKIELFGLEFKAPGPIETYLEGEYGEDWRTPAEDSVSRTRVYRHREKEKIPYEFLETCVETQHS